LRLSATRRFQLFVPVPSRGRTGRRSRVALPFSSAIDLRRGCRSQGLTSVVYGVGTKRSRRTRSRPPLSR
jgi:hypothetical protein